LNQASPPFSSPNPYLTERKKTIERVVRLKKKITVVWFEKKYGVCGSRVREKKKYDTGDVIRSKLGSYLIFN